MQCSNKLKQLALAGHDFHDSHNRFPCNGNDPLWISYRQYGNTNNRLDAVDVYSWLVCILPFIEQTAMHDEITAACEYASSVNPYPGNNPSGGWNHPAMGAQMYNTAAGQRVNPFYSTIDAFCCPSDGEATRGGMERRMVAPVIGCAVATQKLAGDGERSAVFLGAVGHKGA
jgi:hypothetical protein